MYYAWTYSLENDKVINHNDLVNLKFELLKYYYKNTGEFNP